MIEEPPQSVPDSSSADEVPPAEFEDVVCLGCGCLCDDLAVRVKGGKLLEIRNACDMGLDWFENAVESIEGPEAAIEGRAATRDAGLDRAAAILRGAKRPVFFGLTRATTEAIRTTLGLADQLGALVLLSETAERIDRAQAVQEVGKVTATLGEVRNRADLVLFWGGEPTTELPRHAERYSIEPISRFLPRGRADRFIIVIEGPGASAPKYADMTIEISDDRQLEFASAIRLALREPSETEALGLAIGLSVGLFPEFVSRLRSARYGALFYRSPLEPSPFARAGWVAVSSLVRELNERRRFVLMEHGKPGNATGALAAMTWRTGFAPAVDFRRGVPSPVEDQRSLEEVLCRGEIDALVVVTDPLPVRFSESAREQLQRLPLVVIAPDATRRQGVTPTVALTSAVTGVESAGSVSRSDGVMLPLRPLRASRFPTERAWLRRLGRRLYNA